jgi:hypothetical protein
MNDELSVVGGQLSVVYGRAACAFKSAREIVRHKQLTTDN